MKIACLSVSFALAAAVAGAQGSQPVHVTHVMRPAAGGALSGSQLPAAGNAQLAPAVNSQSVSVQSFSSPSGITYICDSTLFNLAAIDCNAINATVAGLYAGIFANANARIYIKLGKTGLGASDYLTYSLDYTGYRNALLSNQTDGDDIAAVNGSVPSASPMGTGNQVYLAGPLYRALGFTPDTGFQADGTQCALTGNACYDGIITISTSMATGGNLYMRTGSISPSQYDLFTIVEHETDEILGMGSCAFGCTPAGSFAPVDLFRYQSNGTRSFAAGNNSSCVVALAGNACFSLDGVHMLQQYNNLNNGDDAGDWLTNCLHPLVQDAVGCPGVAGVDISPAAEIRVLDVIGYSLATPVSVRVVTKVTSNTTGLVNGVCSTPPLITNFTVTSPQVWLYFSVTGANVGDTAQMTFLRPDGAVYTTLRSAQVTSAGAQCFSYSIDVNGAAAASFPGTWTVNVTWNQSATPLFTLNFNISSSACPYTLDSSGQAFGPTGGAASINITVPDGCVWSVSNSLSWVTLISAGGSGNGTVSFEVAPNPGADRSGTMTVAGVPYSLEQESASAPGPFFGSMPHIAAEENWTTAFTLLNKGTTSAQARLSFFGDPSGALALPLVFPQQPAAGAPLLASSLDRTLPANASLVVNTAGPQNPPVLMGSAQVTASNGVDGFAIFHLIPGAQEAVVPLETRNASSYVLAYGNTNSAVLAVALANVSSQTATIGVVLRASSGAQFGTDNLTVPANGHISFVLPQKYPLTGTTYPTGTIEFDAPAGQISVLGIRTTPLGTTTTLTTVPALANVGTNGGSIAHIATGNGWQTTFVLVNTGSLAAQANLRFYDDTGLPLPLPISYPQSGPATTTVSTLTQTLAAGGMLLVESMKPASDPAPTMGSAQLSTNGNVSGFVIFRYNPSGQEAVVPLDSNTLANARILAFDNSKGTDTGVAVNSVASAAASIPVILRNDSGAQIGTDTLTLSPNGHYAFDLTSRYPQTLGIRGTIEFDTPSSGQIGVIGIRTPATHTYTSLPALIR